MPTVRLAGPPAPQGLYDPRFEHDACGVNFVVHMKGLRSHEIVQHGIGALCNLDHRGAPGAEANTGDGAGILIQIPDRFFRDVVDFHLPAEGHYATGIAFLPARPGEGGRGRRRHREDRGQRGPAGARLARRPVRRLDDRLRSARGGRAGRSASCSWPATASPTRPSSGGSTSCASGSSTSSGSLADGGVYFPSLSCRTIVYKGMLTTPQLPEFFPDLRDERVESALALVHSRFSTNTFPSWPLAHPFRYVAHNGEINTVQGNRNWMRAREALLPDEAAARRARADLPDLHRPAPATRPPSTRCSSCCTWAATRCPTPC